jgi:DNA-directed RNA polymerase specialized sigma24 family protein
MEHLLLEPSEELAQACLSLPDGRYVQDEPALEIALPHVFTQPALTALQRGKLPNVEWLIARLCRSLDVGHQANGHSLGPDYQALVNEFQPLFTWATASWDYLLSTEGCRFVLRSGSEKACCRGDYRAVTSTDYSRLTHRVFRRCVLEFSQQLLAQSFAGFLRARFWEAVVAEYRHLDTPPDPSQRKLTPYSYLRCVPYRFLNDFHEELVRRTIRKLPHDALRVIELYFLRFLTLQATASTLSLSAQAVEAALQRGLMTLLMEDRLVYCLLRQIERY